MNAKTDCQCCGPCECCAPCDAFEGKCDHLCGDNATEEVLEEGRVATESETTTRATSTTTSNAVGDDDATTASNISFTGDTRAVSSVGHPGFYAGQHPHYKDYAYHRHGREDDDDLSEEEIEIEFGSEDRSSSNGKFGRGGGGDDDGKKGCLAWLCCCWCPLLCCLLILLAILLPLFLLRGRDDDGAAKSNARGVDDFDIDQYTKDVHAKLHPISGDAITAEGTPQKAAYDWIVAGAIDYADGKEDASTPRDVNDPRFVQRYALGVSHAALGGDNWTMCTPEVGCTKDKDIPDQLGLSSGGTTSGTDATNVDNTSSVGTTAADATGGGVNSGSTNADNHGVGSKEDSSANTEAKSSTMASVSANTIHDEYPGGNSGATTNTAGANANGNANIASYDASGEYADKSNSETNKRDQKDHVNGDAKVNSNKNDGNADTDTNIDALGSVARTAPWLSAGDECTWHGLACDDEGMVVGINLASPSGEDNGVHGVIPKEIGEMSSLQSLNLSNSDISGPIPNSLANTNLGRLDLSGNSIDGTFPVSLHGNRQITEINIANNKLTGPLPDVGSMPNLKKFDASNNSFSSTIPDNFSSKNKLKDLRIAYNQLEGSFPSTLSSNGHLLQRIDVSDNHLSGPLPDLGYMQNLVHVNARKNDFTGEIPASTGSLLNLRVVDLSHNGLSGTLTDEIGKAQALQKIILNNNDLQGTISSDIVSLPRLFQLNLAANSLSGNIPEDIGDMGKGWTEEGKRRKTMINLETNSLDGDIPASIGNIDGLRVLTIDGNQFNPGQSLPETVCSLETSPTDPFALQTIASDCSQVDCRCTVACSCIFPDVDSDGDNASDIAEDAALTDKYDINSTPQKGDSGT